MSKNTKGYVYILSNESFPGLLKIGASKIGGHRRAEELYSAGLPSPFILEFEIFCNNAFAAEAIVHNVLLECRHNDKREFFKIELEAAIIEVSSSCLSKSFERPVIVGSANKFYTLDEVIEIKRKGISRLALVCRNHKEEIESLVESLTRTFLS